MSTLPDLTSCDTPTGSVVRDEMRMSWLLDTGHSYSLLRANLAMLGSLATEDLWCVSEAGGYIRGAACDDALIVYEAAAATDKATEVVLNGLDVLRAERGLERVIPSLPGDHGLVRESEAEPVGRDDPEFQFRVIDLTQCLKAAVDVIERRLSETMPDWCGAFTLETGGEKMCFDWRGDAFRFTLSLSGQDGQIQMSEWGLGRFLLGQDDLGKAAAAPGHDGELDRVLLTDLFTLPAACLCFRRYIVLKEAFMSEFRSGNGHVRSTRGMDGLKM